MPGLEVGAVCIKTRGREAGKKAVILEFDKKTGFAVIGGKHVKRRKCNIMHLVPTGEKLNPKSVEIKKPREKKKASGEKKEKEKAGEKKKGK